MAVKVIDGDLFNSTARVICHQVNCRGKMRSGVARQIREKYPLAYERYRLAYNREDDKSNLLGRIQFVYCKDAGVEGGLRMIVNMFAQDRYGYDGKRYTDYTAFEYCLERLRHIIKPGESIAMPYNIGCGLAGGDWGVIYNLIERILSQRYTVELWKLT